MAIKAENMPFMTKEGNADDLNGRLYQVGVLVVTLKIMPRGRDSQSTAVKSQFQA
jgi:hypothetical protein